MENDEFSFLFLQLFPPEQCENEQTYCGGDLSKYPLEEIEMILNNTVELQVSLATMHRFFTPVSVTEDNSEENIEGAAGEEDKTEALRDLACEAERKMIPRYTRAKNVNNKWVYLAQMGNREIQQVEVTLCLRPGEKCINDLDSPHGEGSTLCRQIFSTHKLLALDTDGNVNVDTFDLPSACVCKTKIKPFNEFDAEVGLRGLPLFLNKAQGVCGFSDEPTKSIVHERFNRGGSEDSIDQADDIFKSTDLKEVANSVTPCQDQDSICDEAADDYPEDSVKLILFRHKLFANREYFQRLFGKPCILAKPEDLRTRLGFDLEESALCDTLETYIYPKKARNIQGVWKYVINTDGYRQGVSVHRCMKQVHKKPCTYAGSQGKIPEATECRQMFSRQSLLSISLDGSVEYDSFAVPTACVCHITDKNYFYFNDY